MAIKFVKSVYRKKIVSKSGKSFLYYCETLSVAYNAFLTMIVEFMKATEKLFYSIAWKIVVKWHLIFGSENIFVFNAQFRWAKGEIGLW